MRKIQWTDLPAALRDHLFERLREGKITAEELYQWKLWRPKDSGTRILDRSRFAAKGNIPKHFCCVAKLRKAKDRRTSVG